MEKYFPILYFLLLLLILGILCCLYALQYNSSCQNALSYHIFDLLKFFAKFVHNIIKDFSWAFLILLLFLLPHCMENINILVGKVGEIAADYGRAINPATISEQSTEEKKDFKKEQDASLKINLEEAKTSLKERRERRDKLKKFVEKQIKDNYDDFTPTSKLIFDNDPVLSAGALLFDCSYRYRARRYINTLYILNSNVLLNDNKLYKYIRIINDVNKSKKNQRYAVEIVILSVDDTYGSNLYNQYVKTYAEALGNGILALKEYRFDNGVPQLANKTGWILD